jgi:hypothetical protein
VERNKKNRKKNKKTKKKSSTKFFLKCGNTQQSINSLWQAVFVLTQRKTDVKETREKRCTPSNVFQSNMVQLRVLVAPQCPGNADRLIVITPISVEMAALIDDTRLCNSLSTICWSICAHALSFA